MPREAKVIDGLSEKEALFVEHYLATQPRNATLAAERAGYSKRTAAQAGAKLLARATVMAAIEARTAVVLEHAKVDVQRVVDELAVVGFSSVGDYVIDNDGHVTLAEGAPASALRAVSSIKRKTRYIPQKDKDDIVEHDTEIKLWPKTTALHDLGTWLKMFAPESKAPEDDTSLTPEERRERVLVLLKGAAKRLETEKASAGPAPRPGKRRIS